MTTMITVGRRDHVYEFTVLLASRHSQGRGVMARTRMCVVSARSALEIVMVAGPFLGAGMSISAVCKGNLLTTVALVPSGSDLHPGGMLPPCMDDVLPAMGCPQEFAAFLSGISRGDDASTPSPADVCACAPVHGPARTEIA